MINLMPPPVYKDLKAARLNVVLVRYVIMLLALVIMVAIVYGVGFWLVNGEKKAMTSRLHQQNEQSKEYAEVQSEAKVFRDNLKTAKSILDNGTPYSKFLTILARDIPDGTFISSLSLGGSSTGAGRSANSTDIRARAISYEKAVALKDSLEESKLFENVRVTSIYRPDNIDGLSGLEKKYPHEVTMSATLSKLDYTQESF